MENKEKYNSNQLAEERTLLAFIRTCAIFCGLYVLLTKNVKFAYANFMLISIAVVLIYRLLNINYSAHKAHVQILGGLLLISMFIIIFYAK